MATYTADEVLLDDETATESEPNTADEVLLETIGINDEGFDEGDVVTLDALNGQKSIPGFGFVTLQVQDEVGDPLTEISYLAARDGSPGIGGFVGANATVTLQLRNGTAHTDFVGIAGYSPNPDVDYAWYSIDEQLEIDPANVGTQAIGDVEAVVVLRPGQISLDDLAKVGSPIGGDVGVSPQWSLTLELGDEAITLPADDISNPRLNLEHTAISSWEVDLPYSLAAETWTRATAILRFGDEVLMTGVLDTASSDDGNATTTLSGRDELAKLARGGVQEAYQEKFAWVAIEEYWETYAPSDWEVTVHVPDPPPGGDEPVTLQDAKYAGSHFENIQQLHQDAGMRFAIQYRDPAEGGPIVESFRPGEVVRTAGWTTQNHQRVVDASEYANVVTAYGGEDDDGDLLLRETAEDASEIDRVGERVKAPPVIEPKIRDRTALRAVAVTELQDRVGKDQLEGSLSIVPQPIPPGYSYEIPEFGATLSLESVSFADGIGPSGDLAFMEETNLATEIAAARGRDREALGAGVIGVGGGGSTGTGRGDSDSEGDGDPLSPIGVYGGGVYGDSAEGG